MFIDDVIHKVYPIVEADEFKNDPAVIRLGMYISRVYNQIGGVNGSREFKGFNPTVSEVSQLYDVYTDIVRYNVEPKDITIVSKTVMNILKCFGFNIEQHGSNWALAESKLLSEASGNFVPGSAAQVVYNFYRAIRNYYSNMLIYQFQLYSDLPKTLFNLTGVYVKLTDADPVTILFSAGNGTDLSKLKVLNDYDFSDVTSIEYDFELIPELFYLTKEIEHSPNAELFTKDREISVRNGDGTFETGVFKPQWNDQGLTISCIGFSQDTSAEFGMYNSAGTIRLDNTLTTSLI